MAIPKKSATVTRRIKKTAEMLIALLKQRDIEWKAYPLRDCSDEYYMLIWKLMPDLERIVELSDAEVAYLYQQKKGK